MAARSRHFAPPRGLTAGLAGLACLTAMAAAAPSADARLTFAFEKRTLVIQGGNGRERARVACDGDGDVRVNGRLVDGGVRCFKVIEIDARMGGGNDLLDYSRVGDEFGETTFRGFGTGTGVAAELGDGDDRFIPSPVAFNFARGEAGNDRLRGGRTVDRLEGGSGDDVANGGAGRDFLVGNAGADRLSGGDGADVISGNAGDDLLIGGAGSDVMGGGSGMDRLRGGPGPDKLFGGAGRDKLAGGSGKDRETQ